MAQSDHAEFYRAVDNHIPLRPQIARQSQLNTGHGVKQQSGRQHAAAAQADRLPSWQSSRCRPSDEIK